MPPRFAFRGYGVLLLGRSCWAASAGSARAASSTRASGTTAAAGTTVAAGSTVAAGRAAAAIAAMSADKATGHESDRCDIEILPVGDATLPPGIEREISRDRTEEIA